MYMHKAVEVSRAPAATAINAIDCLEERNAVLLVPHNKIFLECKEWL